MKKTTMILQNPICAAICDALIDAEAVNPLHAIALEALTLRANIKLMGQKHRTASTGTVNRYARPSILGCVVSIQGWRWIDLEAYHQLEVNARERSA